MRLSIKAVIVAAIIVIALAAWAPWITYDYAVSKVVEKLGGQDTVFQYLGQDMPVGEIPKQVSWVPFGRFVTFPGEAGWFVSFFGSVN
jgi:hypothetical protein